MQDVHSDEQCKHEEFVPLRKDQMGNIVGVNFVDVQAIYPAARGLFFVENGEVIKLKLQLHIKQLKKASEMRIRDFDAQLVLPPNHEWSSARTYYVDESGDMALPTGLCLSGGGLRAYFIHLGALKRLNEIKFLQCINTFTSVSGGSLLLGILAIAWDDLKKNDFSQEAFSDYFEQPALKFAENHFASTVFVWQKFSISKWARRFFTSATTSTFLSEMYVQAEESTKKNLMTQYSAEGKSITLGIAFDKPLSLALPEPGPNTPFFVFCGTDMRSGNPFYFSQKCVGSLYPEEKHLYMHYDMSMAEHIRLANTVTLAQAMAASSAYPLAFEPLLIDYESEGGEKLRAIVTDGGVYDNLGLDPLLVPNIYMKVPVPVYYNNEIHKDPKNFVPHLFVLVSDGGLPVLEDDSPNYHLFTTSGLRTISLIGDQVDRLRKRLIKEGFKNYALAGAVWSINDLWDYVYDVSELVQIKNENKDKSTAAVEKTGGVVEANEALKIAEGLPEKLLEEKITQIFRTLVKEKNYPDLEKMFDISIEGNPKENCARARKIVNMITTIRTDLDRFYPEEVKILVALGYTLCAYKMRLYCFRELAHLPSAKANPDPPFSMDVSELNMSYFESSLNLAGSIFNGPRRYLIFLGKTLLKKIFHPKKSPFLNLKKN